MNESKLKFYGGSFGAFVPLLVFMACMVLIAAMKMVSLVFSAWRASQDSALPSFWQRTKRSLRKR